MTKVLNGIFVLLMMVTAVSMSDAQAPVPAPIEEFLSSPGVDRDVTGVYILELDGGRVVGEYRAGEPLVPASVMKCVTTASLLNEVGEDWVYETPVFATGPVVENVLEGDIVVQGSADPSVNSRNTDSADLLAEIMKTLKSAGVDTVRGRIVVDESRFEGTAVNPTWMQADLSEDYGTGTHAFNFEDNAEGNHSVRHPAEVFVRKLKHRLSLGGIAVLDSANIKVRKRDARVLGVHRSEPVRDIMRSCMMRSDNQFAESMLRTYSRERGGDGSIQNGADAEIGYWKRHRLPMDHVRIVDGSGLSRANRLTPVFLGQLLARMSSNPYYASFFPLAGQEGTLRRFGAGTGLEGYAALKTGSMRGIQSYAGYLLNDDYVPTHVIVIMMNNLGNRAAARKALQKMLQKMLLPEEDITQDNPETEENE